MTIISSQSQMSFVLLFEREDQVWCGDSNVQFFSFSFGSRKLHLSENGTSFSQTKLRFKRVRIVHLLRCIPGWPRQLR